MKNCLWILLALSPLTYADDECTVHTWHKISTTRGQWHVSVRYISEQGQFFERTCKRQIDADITPQSLVRYGTSVYPDSTFDIAYTITAVRQDLNESFINPTCVFVVNAKGPAIPDIRIESYHGATCSYTDDHGADFFVS